MYYWMHKEYGHIVPENKLFNDACELGYDDVTDPTSCEYGNYELYYTKTKLRVIPAISFFICKKFPWKNLTIPFPKLRC